jgi:hypothetical protein
LELQSTGAGNCSVEFSPAVSLRARIIKVQLDGRPLPFHLQANPSDQHIAINLPLIENRSTVEIQVKNDFELSAPVTLPALGSTGHGLRVISESWTPSRDSLSLLVSGAPGETYELSAWNPGQIRSVEGAELEKGTVQEAKVRVQLPVAAPDSDSQAKVIFHFAVR